MRRKTDFIVIHCTATGPDSDIGVDEIDTWHRAKGWDGCGYHAVIRRDGTLEFGRPFDVPGAHVKGYNTRSVGIACVGGIDKNGDPDDNFTRDQYATMIDLVETLLKAYPAAQVVGHRDLSPDLDGDGIIEENEWMKSCPCFEVKDYFG